MAWIQIDLPSFNIYYLLTFFLKVLSLFSFIQFTPCCNPTLKECEDDTHTPEMGTWESSGTPENSELDCRGQNTLPWGVLHTIGKVLKRICRKWPRMSHSDIYCTSYVWKKGRESNWQFDSRPLKVRNRPGFLACRRRATYRWKDLDKGYDFASDLIAIRGLHKKLCALKVVEVPIVTISGLPLGSPGTKGHMDVVPVERRKVYYMGGKWWLPSSPGCDESSESRVACGLS
jgi:hypothetical protein